jgi:hypothetical protein
MTMIGSTQADFDAADKVVDLAGNPPDGLIFHTSGPIEGGWSNIDIWESREAFDAFVPRVQRAMQEARIELGTQPQLEEFAVHEYFQGK